MAALRNYKAVICKSWGTGSGGQIACPFAYETNPKVKDWSPEEKKNRKLQLWDLTELWNVWKKACRTDVDRNCYVDAITLDTYKIFLGPQFSFPLHIQNCDYQYVRTAGMLTLVSHRFFFCRWLVARGILREFYRELLFAAISVAFAGF
jgi:hypothetical protein